MTLAAAALSLLLASLAAPPAAGAPPPADPPPIAEEPSFDDPPAGAAADQALWRALRDETGLATVSLARIAQSAFRIRYEQPYQALDAAGADVVRAGPARALRARLEAAAVVADRAAPKGPRPNIRTCRYALLFLGQAMSEPEGSRLGATLPAKRDEARSCLEDMRTLHATARPAADGLEAALREVDVFLGRAPRADPAQALRFAGEAPAEAR
jgi:hypothetical protein